MSLDSTMANTTEIPKSTVGNQTGAIEGIVHAYHDHANDDEAPHLLHQLILEATVARQGADHSFPIKLHYVLGKVSEDGLSHVVSWQPHGRCFLVHDQKEFVDRILKCWFRQSKFASFQRQLNLYGFRRLTTGRDKGAYYHEYFLRSRPLLAHRIVRTRVKGTGTRKPSSPETEPNFYLMGYLPSESASKQQPQLVSPMAARLSLQSILPMALDSATHQQTQPPPPPPSSQALHHTTTSQSIPQAHRNNQMRQQHPLNLGINFSTTPLTTSLTQTSNVHGVGTSTTTVDSGLASLAPFSYLTPTLPVNSPSIPSVAPNQNDVVGHYEAILSLMGRGNNP